MRPLILFFTLLTFFTNGADAQIFSSTPVCGIYYSYDANGARIQRKDDCKGLEDASHNDKALNGVLYPNPTSGSFTVAFNELVRSATISITTIDGLAIATLSMDEGYEIDGNIYGRADGTYLVNAQVTRDDGTQATQSFTLIKVE
jgi:hypothetical protein